MNKKQARRARSAAMAEATKREVLTKNLTAAKEEAIRRAEGGFWHRLWMRLVWFFRPDKRAALEKETDARVAGWYRSLLKRWAHEAYKTTKDPDWIAFQRATLKMRKERRKD